MLQIPRVWAGTQESFDFVMTALASALERAEARASAEDPFDLPPLLEVKEGVGMVPVKGPLISGSAGWMRVFGVLGYQDIEEAYAQALASKSVKSIFMPVSSGGGSVEGADESADIIKRASAVKPVVAYAAGPMASAAYWISSGATRRFGSRTSIVGSLGTLIIHSERSKQRAEDGITDTVIRSGRWKALVNGLEPLTDDAKAQLKEMALAMNDIFEERVSANLGVSRKVVHDKMGQGREFLGAKAVEVGLLHGISTFQEAFMAAKLLGAKS